MSEFEITPRSTLPQHPRYALTKKLAQGDFAILFQGRDVELDREIAVKQIHSQYLEDPQQLAVYWREAQLIASLEHPRIMTIYDLVRERGWLILELMIGNITQVLKGRQIDLADLRSLLTSMARGLQFLEANGILHGDVKPSNMLVDKNRHLKLGDFGLARRLGGGEGSVVKGTAKYMAPEVVSDQFGDVGPHSDLYSLGFSAYELMCGPHFELLFPGLKMFGRDQQSAWMMWHAAADRQLPKIHRVLQNVPDDLAHVIDRLCEKDPAERYRTAAEVLDDLAPDRSGPRKSADPAGSSMDVPAGPARRKRLVTIAAVAVSVFLSIGLALLPGNSPPEVVEPPAPRIKEPDQGVLVAIDLPHGRLVVRTDDDQDHEVPINPEDRIVLNNRELITAQQLRERDQVAIRPIEVVEGTTVQRLFDITRPEISAVRGSISRRNLTARTLIITPHDAAQDLAPIFVPSNVEILVNGLVGSLQDLQPGDRIVAEYLPDREGLKAESVEVQRRVELVGTIDAIRLPSHLTVRQPDSTSREFQVDEACRISLNRRTTDSEGVPLALRDLQRGDQIVIEHDRTIHRIRAERVITFAGTIERVDAQRQQLAVRLNEGTLREFSFAGESQVQLADGERVEVTELRTGDAVSVTEDPQQGFARTIEVAFAPDRSIWAIVIGHARYEDQRLQVPETAKAGAELIRRTLLRRARVPQEQLLWLADPTRFSLERSVRDFLARVPTTARLFVYFAGHATQTEQQEVFLAARDFDPSRPVESGVDLAKLLDSLETEGEVAGERLLLLDVQHGGPDRRWQPAAEELLDTLKSRRGNVSRSLTVIGNSSQGQIDISSEESETGVFATATAAALQGKADYDHDHVITAEELFRYLRIEVPARALAAGYELIPVRYKPEENRLTPQQQQALKNLLERLKRGGRIDDGWATDYHHAVTLTPGLPDAHLLHALMLLSANRHRHAETTFREIVDQFPHHPHTLIAYHGLAWIRARSQDYQDSLQYLAQALEQIPESHEAYADSLFVFAAKLYGFVQAVSDEEALEPDLSHIPQAVSAHGKPAQDRFREAWHEVRAETRRRAAAIEASRTERDQAIARVNYQNINLYLSFDAEPILAYFDQLLSPPR